MNWLRNLFSCCGSYCWPYSLGVPESECKCNCHDDSPLDWL